MGDFDLGYFGSGEFCVDDFLGDLDLDLDGLDSDSSLGGRQPSTVYFRQFKASAEQLRAPKRPE